MPIPRYGVWKGIPNKWEPTSKPGHGHITFSDGASSHLDAAVNIQSQSADSRLVYWFLRDFDKTHPIAQGLQSLNQGFFAQNGPSSLGLDFLRGNFLDVNDGILLSHDAPGESHDILDYLNPILNQAVTKKATIYLFGQKYSGNDGIHDIHMNQGNSGQWKRDNGTYQDGGIVLAFPDGHWEGIFLAFAVQTYQTDSTGQPVGKTFADLLSGKAGPAPGPTPEQPGPEPEPQPPTPAAGISIQAALVNPFGPDQTPTRGEGETVYLLNRATEAVSLEGWSISNGAGQTQALHGIRLGAQSKKAVAVPNAPLSNRGGSIVLKDSSGKVVDKVTYTKEQATIEGTLVYFQQKQLKN
ncbi:hypothetical protein B0H63DRAFT_489642 [Podospora didyma]|uniref:LTD domain-containing protein n=1 Tax=Podospora didyma TaxID=330526 RepID=A0AAE0N354_9PEZI|nr:hypothetical protein B0H63DRAFT_489642 [Podospora didyma]